MKILVTGGAGFIGSNIVDAYLEQGHDVIVVDDLSSGLKANISKKIAFHQLSITSPQLSDLIADEKPDVVNHHAAQIDVRKSVEDPAADAQINIIGSLNLLESSRKAGVKKIIFASTGGAIYGEQSEFPAPETHPTNPISPYGVAKLCVEKYLGFYKAVYGLNSTILRYANVYGPRQRSEGEAGVVAIFSGRLLKQEDLIIFGDGQQTRDYVYVGDVVKCNVAALSDDVSGVYNVGTGVETSVETLAKELISISGVDVSLNFQPARPGEQARSCIQPSVLLVDGTVSLKQGLQETFTWFQAQPNL